MNWIGYLLDWVSSVCCIDYQYLLQKSTPLTTSSVIVWSLKKVIFHKNNLFNKFEFWQSEPLLCALQLRKTIFCSEIQSDFWALSTNTYFWHQIIQLFYTFRWAVVRRIWRIIEPRRATQDQGGTMDSLWLPDSRHPQSKVKRLKVACFNRKRIISSSCSCR